MYVQETSGSGGIPNRRLYSASLLAGTGVIPVATVTVWMEEDFLKSFFIVFVS